MDTTLLRNYKVLLQRNYKVQIGRTSSLTVLVTGGLWLAGWRKDSVLECLHLLQKLDLVQSIVGRRLPVTFHVLGFDTLRWNMPVSHLIEH